MILRNDLIRPQNFLSNTTKVSSKYVPKLPPSKRTGRNYEMMRTNFLAPDIKGRNVKAYLEAESTDQVVELGESTLQKLFQVQVDDASDQAWISEKNRRLALGETEEQIKANPPFGRPQRKVMKNLNFAAQGLDINDKIELSKNAILQGVNLNQQQLANILANITQILGNTQQIGQITYTGFVNLQQGLNQLNLPKTWQQAGFTHRFFTLEQYAREAGLVNLFLLSNMGQIANRTLQMPVVLYPSGTDINNPLNATPTPIHVSNIARNLQRGGSSFGKFLDLETRAIYRLEDVVQLVNSGVDGGRLNGQDPPIGGWLPNKEPFWDYFNYAQNNVRLSQGINPQNLQGSPRMNVNYDDWIQTVEGQNIMGNQPAPLPLPIAPAPSQPLPQPPPQPPLPNQPPPQPQRTPSAP